jgi:hypothetical protein
MRQHLDRDQLWKAAKAAVHAYEDDPTEINALKVTRVVKLIRGLNEESIWRQPKGVSRSLKPTHRGGHERS